MTDIAMPSKNSGARPTALDLWSDNEDMATNEKVKFECRDRALQTDDESRTCPRHLELPMRSKDGCFYSSTRELSAMQSPSAPITKEQPPPEAITFSPAELPHIELALIPATHRNVREIANHLVDIEEPELGKYLVKIDYDDPLQEFRNVPSFGNDIGDDNEAEQGPNHTHVSHGNAVDRTQTMSFDDWKKDFDSHMDEDHAFLLTESAPYVQSPPHQQSPTSSMRIPFTLPIITPYDFNIFRDPASVAVNPDHLPPAPRAAAFTEDLCSRET